MKFSITAILGILGIGASNNAKPVYQTYFVFAVIQDKISPTDRSKKYGDPLDKALQTKKLGEVTGGGSQLAADGSVEWIGIDIELIDLEDALIFTKNTLRELGAPHGSILEYNVNNKKMIIEIN
jgi:hypothetical protein